MHGRVLVARPCGSTIADGITRLHPQEVDGIRDRPLQEPAASAEVERTAKITAGPICRVDVTWVGSARRFDSDLRGNAVDARGRKDRLGAVGTGAVGTAPAPSITPLAAFEEVARKDEARELLQGWPRRRLDPPAGVAVQRSRLVLRGRPPDPLGKHRRWSPSSATTGALTSMRVARMQQPNRAASDQGLFGADATAAAGTMSRSPGDEIRGSHLLRASTLA